MKPRGATGRCAVACALWLSVLASAAGEPAAGGEPDFGPAMFSANRAIVLVTSYSELGEDVPGCPSGKPIAHNAGFLVSEGGHVLTSIHALSGCSKADVVSADGSRSPARMVAFDQRIGLALLSTGVKGVEPLQVAREPVRPGQWIVSACARPAADGTVVVATAAAPISSVEGTLRLSGNRWDNLLVTAAAGTKGTAGAPVLTASGELAGVIVATGTWRGTPGCCFALAASELEPILNSLLDHNSQKLGWMGVVLGEPDDGRGVAVKGVMEESPAHRAGVLPGDVLLELDGEPIVGTSLFEQKVVNGIPGSEVQVTLLRHGRIEGASALIAPRPLFIVRNPARLGTGRRDEFVQWGGVAVGSDWGDAGGPYRQTILSLLCENELLRERIMQMEVRISRLESSAR